MRQGRIGIAPEGYPFIILCAFSTLIFAVIGCWPVAVVLLAGTWFAGHFFRDPERVVPSGPGLAVSPADGKVIKIQPEPDPFTGKPRTCVSIFMNVCNVHVNRMPVTGKIAAIAYHPGKFFNASWDKASRDNERCAYAVEGKDGSFTMVQVAGLVARRIVCRVGEGEKLDRGERCGMIRFGSRVDLYLPDDYVPTVGIGRTVFAGQTVLAERNAREK
ncbi:MAG: phosphatidylserine decarboxylase family protein [Deltaproteobacteria bacterium]|nr:phosphatidylserine decarboxylase family protein [Deltaproteobacteria bacterium]